MKLENLKKILNPTAKPSLSSTFPDTDFNPLSTTLLDNKSAYSICRLCSRIEIENSSHLLKARKKILGDERVLSLLNTVETSLDTDIKIEAPTLLQVELFQFCYPFIAFILSKEQKENYKKIEQFIRRFLDLPQLSLSKYDRYFSGQRKAGSQVDLDLEFSAIRKPEFFPSQQQVQEKSSSKEKPKLKFTLETKETTILSTEEKMSYLESLLSMPFSFKKLHEPTPTIADLLSTLSLENSKYVFKNLFLRGKASGGKKHFFLLSVPHETVIDYKQLTTALSTSLGLKLKSAVRQATREELLQYLNIEGGNISPFSLAEDKERVVEFVFPKKVEANATLYFHPLTNEATIGISLDSLQQFVKATGREIVQVEFGQVEK
eukprot:snap_masked-scaffold_2-processed-gene-13.6-mRNA-1 protein AED:1.00 eAED:1.00 QI:0/-1/0/0/-1/1/1/0/376